MAVIALVTAAGAPGATTTALGLAALWPRACIVVEADLTGSSAVLAGHFRGAVRHDRGLVGLAIAHQQRDLTPEDLWEQAIGLLTERTYVVPGIADPAQAGPLAGLWPPLAGLLGDLEQAGTDVVVDAGRLGQRNAPAALVSAADLVLLVLGSSLRDIAAARANAATLAQWRGGETRTGAGLLLVGSGRPYSTAEVAQAVGLPVVSEVAWQPKAATVLSEGVPRPRRWAKGRLATSYALAGTAVGQAIAERRAWLQPGRALAGATKGAR
mgnify:CR=1 FL=1